MLELQDDHCKIIATDDVEKAAALKILMNVNIDKAIAEKLIEETIMEVRKYKSGKPMMDECAVIKASTGVLWNIPRKILERVDRK